MNLMFDPLRKYATFEGRARRTEYWLFWLFTIVVEMIGSALTGGYGNPMAIHFGIGFALYALICLALFVPSIAVGVRRLHDTDKSGWFILIGLIPFVGGIILLVFMCIDSTRGTNQWGPSEKYA